MLEEIYGQDILLDSTGQAVILASGEAQLSDGIETVLQDIKLRLFTPYGSLFYDRLFGSYLIDFVKDENTESNRIAVTAEVKRCINREPRVRPGTVTCTLVSWDHTGIVLRAVFSLIDVSHPFNMVITVDSDMEVVINDVYTD